MRRAMELMLTDYKIPCNNIFMHAVLPEFDRKCMKLPATKLPTCAQRASVR